MVIDIIFKKLHLQRAIGHSQDNRGLSRAPDHDRHTPKAIADNCMWFDR